MGSDIHLYAEANINKIWVPAGEIRYVDDRRNYESQYDCRNYRLFGILANVRGEGAIDEPRGFPEDASEIIQKIYESWKDDAHTPSYYHLDELIENKKKFSCDRDFQFLIKDLTYLCEIHNLPTNKMRVVFWFDC